MLHIVYAEKLLEGHTADPRYGIEACKSQGGNAHGHKALSRIYRDPEHFQESCHACGKDGERRSCSRCSVRSRSRACDAESQDRQQAFQHHRAITDFEHILFISNSL